MCITNKNSNPRKASQPETKYKKQNNGMKRKAPMQNHKLAK